MHIVHIQLTEDILSVRIDGMETRETFLGDFLGCHTQGDVLQNLSLSLGEVDFLLHIMRWS